MMINELKDKISKLTDQLAEQDHRLTQIVKKIAALGNRESQLLLLAMGNASVLGKEDSPSATRINKELEKARAKRVENEGRKDQLEAEKKKTKKQLDKFNNRLADEDRISNKITSLHNEVRAFRESKLEEISKLKIELMDKRKKFRKENDGKE